ncbi:hypothetical protein C3497_12540 [Zoogloeaceae bacteirum Par-f-2]|nr:hypothetical protein C3497_12540 [Zoogloeaceae bacteirum Par-f-2]
MPASGSAVSFLPCSCSLSRPLPRSVTKARLSLIPLASFLGDISLRYLASIAQLQDVHYLWRPFLRDPDDDMVLECAVASGSQYLVTHNIRDFQRIGELGVTPITPASFLALLRSSS